jgi:potassium/hydrogen antiporter
LLALSVLLSRAIGRRGLPVVLLFLLLGMRAGSEGPGGIDFEDDALTFRLGTDAFVFILFDGGLNTLLDVVKKSLGPTGALATAGVAFTARILAVVGKLEPTAPASSFRSTFGPRPPCGEPRCPTCHFSRSAATK